MCGSRDDGRGGADPAGGGLSGLARRVAALDGRFRVDSPAGGPTIDHGGAAVRVILAEDSTLLREGLIRLLVEEGHEVPAAVGDGDALLDAVAEHRPDIVVADVRMPPTHTDEGLRGRTGDPAPLAGQRACWSCRSMSRSSYATELMSGDVEGVGYLLKDRVAQVADFLDALDRVGAGGAAFDPEVVRQLLARTTHVDPLSRLTPRERDVLDHMAQGCTNASIAQRLHVSPERRREARQRHLRQTRPPARHRLQPPRPGRAALPRLLTAPGRRFPTESLRLTVRDGCRPTDRRPAASGRRS